MKILIVEDEHLAQKRLTRLLSEICPQADLQGPCDSIEQTVAWLNNYPAPDLLLLDIELADGQCFEIFRQVPVEVPVIFTTAYDEFALKAFDYHSIDYLLKPVEKERLDQALQKYGKWQAQWPGQNPLGDIERLIAEMKAPASENPRQRFLIRLGERYLSLQADQIAWCCTEDKVVFAHTFEGKKYPLDYSLEEVERQLDRQIFFRINRQFLLNHRAIQQIHAYFNGRLKLHLQPAAESEVIVSREKTPAFKEWMGA